MPQHFRTHSKTPASSPKIEPDLFKSLIHLLEPYNVLEPINVPLELHFRKDFLDSALTDRILIGSGTSRKIDGRVVNSRETASSRFGVQMLKYSKHERI